MAGRTETGTIAEREVERAIDALVFDLDGTLADTFGLLLAAFDAATRATRGRELTRAEMVAHFGPGAGTEEAILRALAERKELPADILDLFYHTYAAEHSAQVTLFPRLQETLDEARRRGLALGLVTGKGRRSTEITLRELGIAGYFGAVATGDDAPAPKPDPRGLLNVLARLDVAPARALFVGDTAADIGAGRAAGTLVAIALWNDPDDTALADLGADVVLWTGDDLRALLDRLVPGPA